MRMLIKFFKSCNNRFLCRGSQQHAHAKCAYLSTSDELWQNLRTVCILSHEINKWYARKSIYHSCSVRTEISVSASRGFAKTEISVRTSQLWKILIFRRGLNNIYLGVSLYQRSTIKLDRLIARCVGVSLYQRSTIKLDRLIARCVGVSLYQRSTIKLDSLIARCVGVSLYQRSTIKLDRLIARCVGLGGRSFERIFPVFSPSFTFKVSVLSPSLGLMFLPSFSSDSWIWKRSPTMKQDNSSNLTKTITGPRQAKLCLQGFATN